MLIPHICLFHTLRHMHTTAWPLCNATSSLVLVGSLVNASHNFTCECVCVCVYFLSAGYLVFGLLGTFVIPLCYPAVK